MLKSYVLVGEEQKEINSVLLSFASPASSKKTMVMNFITNAFVADGTSDGIFLNEGQVNMGGMLKEIKSNSVVGGCGIGCYQEERLAEVGLGLTGQGEDGDDAALFRNLCDGATLTQTRKDSTRNQSAEKPRLNFVANTHTHTAHRHQSEQCKLDSNEGTRSRFTGATTKPLKGNKTADYQAMLTKSSDKRGSVILTLALALVKGKHLRHHIKLCEQKAAKTGGADGCTGTNEGTGVGVASQSKVPNWVPRPSSIQDEPALHSTDEPAYCWELSEIPYTMTQAAWKHYVARYSVHEDAWYEQMENLVHSTTFLTSATLEGKATGKIARWSLGVHAFTEMLDLVIKDFVHDQSTGDVDVDDEHMSTSSLLFLLITAYSSTKRGY